MTKIISDVSRTFSEYLLLPRLTKKEHTVANVSLTTPISRFEKGEVPRLSLNIPFVSASMQSVSGTKMAIALSRRGGLAFIYTSQPIEEQAAMVGKVKRYKAGFVPSDSNVKPSTPISEAISLSRQTGHSTIAVTEDGQPNGKFLGILTDKDYWEFEDDLSRPVADFMTPADRVIYGETGISLHDANLLLYQNKKECLPILEKNGNLHSLVFKKDYVDHRNNPDELTDDRKRLVVAAAINTHDYKMRVPALVEAGADVLSIDASDGYTEYQKECSLWIREKYGDAVVLGGGNVVSGDGFRYLAEEAQVDFVKVGIGGGSICITREQKGIGRGQASALMDVVEERNRYFEETGIYVPVCSDGGLANDTQIIIALAMGADFVMMGRYFAMTDESPTPKVSMNGRIYKPYWGEGSNRARNWQRYNNAGEDYLKFEEGVDAYVPMVGSVNDVLAVTLAKLKSTLCNNGAVTLKAFAENAMLTRISEQSFVEGGTSTVTTIDNEQK
ncbi:MAG: IMP dehydrogenase [Deltaproteobacteria bacterium]|nr:IMP dehydrogenase [Deltaproteobacteria bacterium]MBN2674278.1 IMP dehydrogenase [Deltaproteobacteria bacterium]